MSEEKELPQGWCWARLGDIGTLLNGDRGKNYPSKSAFVQAGIPFINAGHLDAGRIDLSEMNYTTEDRFAALNSGKIQPDDILYCLRGSLGKAAIVSGIARGAIASSLAIIRIGDEGCIKYLYYFLVGPTGTEEIRRYDNGSAQPNLSAASVTQFRVPLAPLNEQKRIADKLDAVLTRVDACRERLDRVPVILKRFRQSVLAAATSGKLTEEWRSSHNKGIEENARPPDWRERPLAELCERERVITYGVIKLGAEVPDGVPCLRTSNVRWLHIETEGMKRIAPALSSEYARTILRGGEVLVNVRGTLGGVAVATPEMIGWNVSREVAVVPADASQIDPSYLAFWIGSEASQRWLSRVEKGVAYIGINIEDLRNLPVRLPPVEEQREIVDRVESLHAYADRLEARYTAARAQVERLTPALLAKAFRGELVPQDPNDEPAAVLLARIRAARETAPAKSRPRRGSSQPKTQKAEVTMLNRKDIQDALSR